jgi:LmbE family N-acetylglucosaminyl deacetylase
MPGSEDNHHPQALAAADLQEVTGKVVHYIRMLKPQIVLTFDPIGGYRHPDHIAIQKATEKAFYAASDAKFGACGSVHNLAENSKTNHTIKVFSGILAKESEDLLKSFFAKKRLKSKN